MRFTGMNGSSPAINFLDDSLFFEQHVGELLDPASRPRNTTQPLVELRHSECVSWTDGRLIPWLSESSGVPGDELQEFRVCLLELFHNIQDHTELDVGSVFAQWYPNENRLLLAVADFGPGIPTTVRSVEPELGDAPAIIRAFQDGFSAKSIPQNRGAGLHYLAQNVVLNLAGRLTVQSRGGAVNFEQSGTTVRSVPYTVQGFCPGTLVQVEVRTDRIAFETGNGDFEWS